MTLRAYVIFVNYDRQVAKKIDPDELVDPSEAALLLEVGSGNAISVYRRRYADFPRPAVEKGRCVLWLRADLEAWRRQHPGRQ